MLNKPAGPNPELRICFASLLSFKRKKIGQLAGCLCLSEQKRAFIGGYTQTEKERERVHQAS